VFRPLGGVAATARNFHSHVHFAWHSQSNHPARDRFLQAYAGKA